MRKEYEMTQKSLTSPNKLGEARNIMCQGEMKQEKELEEIKTILSSNTYSSVSSRYSLYSSSVIRVVPERTKKVISFIM